MQLIKKVIFSLTTSFVLCAAISAASVIMLMFTKGKDYGHHVDLLGSIFFEARENQDGSVMIGLGIENPMPLVLLFIFLAAFSFVFFSVFAALQKRKAQLRSEIAK